ncbi:MAG: methionyl-tRNA formyltransferase [Deltaproteobacteria bacterium]|nr:methionyl-tRNA formyltransferase [Deltaproteobacteria bacterium]
MKARIVVMGNKNLAVGCTAHLLGIRGNVVTVVLNPDDDGLDRHGYFSLKRFARSRALPSYQPRNASEPGFVETLRGLSPDLIFSFSYSRIIRKNFLDAFRDRVFNLHFSLLPRNRGCLPLIYALAEGDPETGVTLHLMDEGIDTGDIIAQTRLPITTSDTARTLYFRASAAGLALFAETYPSILDASFLRIPQPEERASYHPQQNPNDRWIDWTWGSERIHAFIRAHTFWPPYPGARFHHKGRLWEVRHLGEDLFQVANGSHSVEMPFSHFMGRFAGDSGK